ncbi:type VI secretion system baseplate subunit TssE [Chitinilyticum litopenaei]|uniref:type VI secretion system baseplate subunit TssE n=1 Tax=Chitinilyticum litopenaei TaxID=1121276 RepID=UPI0004122E05|nr:GPW/gp25 family protein [Chitinilyticum litopenaei]
MTTLFNAPLWDRLVAEPGAGGDLLRPMDKSRLVATVSADLTALLNAIVPAEIFESALPHVAGSVLAFGFPCVSGKSLSSVHIKQIKAWIEESILRFEPRILPESLAVFPVLDKGQSHHQFLAYAIRGLVNARPYPVELELQTRLDLDNGRFAVVDAATGRA